jgi:hypothetical protein
MHQRLTLFFRVFFGCLLLAAALGKLLDNRGFAEVLALYRLPIPAALLLPLALLISLCELALGLAIALGHSLRIAVQGTLLLQLGYLALAVVTYLREIYLANCGCFGVFLARPLTWLTLVEDSGLVLLASVFFWAVRGAQPGARPSGAAVPAGAS